MTALKYILVGIGSVAATAIAIFVYVVTQVGFSISLYFVIGAFILLILTGIAVHYLGDISSSDEE